MEDCKHNWVHRKDGYVEYCIPAICIKCGKYGCICDAQLKDNMQEKEFYAKEIDGNVHEIEKNIKLRGTANCKKFCRFDFMDLS